MKNVKKHLFVIKNIYNTPMEKYDAVIVLLVATILVGSYIYLEARPGGSSLLSSINKTIRRFFRIK